MGAQSAVVTVAIVGVVNPRPSEAVVLAFVLHGARPAVRAVFARVAHRKLGARSTVVAVAIAGPTTARTTAVLADALDGGHGRRGRRWGCGRR